LIWDFRDNFFLGHHSPTACSPSVLQLK